jgi:hypothetical protein
MNWLSEVAGQNEKYKNVIIIQNLEFLSESLSIRNVFALQRLAAQVAESKAEAERSYIEWMVAYEFPAYSGLADRVKELGKRATNEEMGLYVRRCVFHSQFLSIPLSRYDECCLREEVSRAVSKIDQKALDASVATMRKRLDKHFGGFNDASVSPPYPSPCLLHMRLMRCCCCCV